MTERVTRNRCAPRTDKIVIIRTTWHMLAYQSRGGEVQVGMFQPPCLSFRYLCFEEPSPHCLPKVLLSYCERKQVSVSPAGIQ